MKPVLATLIYCLKDGEVLLLQRRAPPFVGLWIGPGGKVEPGESPVEGARRELSEETGLVAEGLALRGVIREVSPRPDWQWLIFIYLVQSFHGALHDKSEEGILRWFSLAQLPEMPESDQRFLPRVLDLDQPFYEARYVYDDQVNLQDVIEHT